MSSDERQTMANGAQYAAAGMEPRRMPASVFLSIIVPAFNEERHLPACLDSIHAACAAVFPSHPITSTGIYELLVADNNSSDGTARLAREHGARVIHEPINQISRARNAGATHAEGQWLLFLDADSHLHPATLQDLMAAVGRGGYVGGGCAIGLDSAPWWGSASVQLWNLTARLMCLASGSFLFCRADAFHELGGFSQELYASEDLDLSARLKRWGKPRGLAFIILHNQPHISSGRKFDLYSSREIVDHFARSLLLFRYTARRPQRLKYFYDGRR